MRGNPAFLTFVYYFFCTFYGNYLKYTKNACKTFSILLK